MSETLFFKKKKKNHSFKTYKKQIWFFCYQFFLNYYHKIDLIFYKSKNIFSSS